MWQARFAKAFKKCHSLLGNFLNALPCNAKNSPISQRDAASLDSSAKG
jgi:hypothetical protein